MLKALANQVLPLDNLPYWDALEKIHIGNKFPLQAPYVRQPWNFLKSVMLETHFPGFSLLCDLMGVKCIGKKMVQYAK